MTHSNLPLNHDNTFVRLQFPCMPTHTAMNRIGGASNVVRATAADEDDVEGAALSFYVGDAMYGPSLRSQRDTSEARLLLRVHTNADGVSTPTVMGVVRTAFSFDGLADYLFDGPVSIRERTYPPDDRRDFLNTATEPLVLQPSWPLAGNNQPIDFNLSVRAGPRTRGGDAGDFSAPQVLSASDPQPTPPALDPALASTECYQRLYEMFQVRPVWQQASLQARFDPSLFHTVHYTAALAALAYRFSGGPFRRSLVRYGYDPRADPRAARYQCIDLRFRDETAAQMQQYASAMKAREEQWLKAEEQSALADIRREFHVQLAPHDPAGAAEDVNFVAAASGVPVEQVKKAEAARRMRMTLAKRRVQQQVALEQVLFAQAPVRSFTMVALEDLRTIDPVIGAALDRIEPTTKYSARLGWLPAAIHAQIAAHLKLRTEQIMRGDRTELHDAATAAVTAELAGRRRGEDEKVPVPDNYATTRREFKEKTEP
jgi:hypothetical protein